MNCERTKNVRQFERSFFWHVYTLVYRYRFTSFFKCVPFLYYIATWFAQNFVSFSDFMLVILVALVLAHFTPPTVNERDAYFESFPSGVDIPSRLKFLPANVVKTAQ